MKTQWGDLMCVTLVINWMIFAISTF